MDQSKIIDTLETYQDPRGVHEAGGAPCRGGRALDPRGQVPAPPTVFSVLDILKYSRKKHTKFAGHLENFYFRDIFIAWIIQKTVRKYYFTLFILNSRK